MFSLFTSLIAQKIMRNAIILEGWMGNEEEKKRENESRGIKFFVKTTYKLLKMNLWFFLQKIVMKRKKKQEGKKNISFFCKYTDTFLKHEFDVLTSQACLNKSNNLLIPQMTTTLTADTLIFLYTQFHRRPRRMPGYRDT